jgi:hypothetical protein
MKKYNTVDIVWHLSGMKSNNILTISSQCSINYSYYYKRIQAL